MIQEVDPLLCPFCGAEMKILAFILDFATAKAIRKSLEPAWRNPSRSQRRHALGTLTGTPKAFIVFFLSFWYVALNDGGKTPALDFAGFFGAADTGVRLSYLAIAITLLLLAQRS